MTAAIPAGNERPADGNLPAADLPDTHPVAPDAAAADVGAAVDADADAAAHAENAARSNAAGAPAARPARRPAAHHISSDELFAGSAELHISHRGAVYRLKQTALGKLILTK